MFRFEVVTDDSGQTLLSAIGSFEIRLKDPFGMLGADGPHPQNDTVVLYTNLLLSPASEE